MTITTLNLEEATKVLRDTGMRISKDSLSEGLKQGMFPFGSAYKGQNGGTVVFIYKKLLDQWIAERAD